MPRYLAATAVLLLVMLVLARTAQFRKLGIQVMKFGEMDKKDFFIVPFALLLFYLILAGVFRWPALGAELFGSPWAAWTGVVFCAAGIALFVWALVSFGRSFRVGLDEDHPGELVTTGAFAFSRNPIYVAFGLVLAGVFLAIPNWIFLAYLLLGGWLVNRQIRLEEASLRKLYGEKYLSYCQKVRRFL